MIGFTVKRSLNGKVAALYRVHDGIRAEQWTPDGWVPAGVEWSGIGGSTDFDPVSVEDAVVILRELGADNLNPVTP